MTQQLLSKHGPPTEGALAPTLVIGSDLQVLDSFCEFFDIFHSTILSRLLCYYCLLSSFSLNKNPHCARDIASASVTSGSFSSASTVGTEGMPARAENYLNFASIAYCALFAGGPHAPEQFANAQERLFRLQDQFLIGSF